MSPSEHAKIVVFDSPGLVEFAIGLANYVLNLLYRKVKFFWEIQLCRVELRKEN